MLLLHHDHHSGLPIYDCQLAIGETRVSRGIQPLVLGFSQSEIRNVHLAIASWSARSDLHAQGCLILSQVGLLFPANHAPKGKLKDRFNHG